MLTVAVIIAAVLQGYMCACVYGLYLLAIMVTVTVTLADRVRGRSRIGGMSRMLRLQIGVGLEV